MSANPYTPPDAPLLPPAPAQTGPSGWTLAYGGLTGTMLAAVGLTWIVPWSEELDPIWTFVEIVDTPVDIFRLFLGLAWLHACWTDLPEAQRDGVSPGRLVLQFFVPLFNIIWLFRAHSQLCQGYDSALMSAGRQPAAPRALAALAPTLHMAAGFIPMANTPHLTSAAYAASGICWVIYMVAVDRVRGAVRSA